MPPVAKREITVKKNLLIGITEGGIMHTDAHPPLSLDEKFKWVKDSGVYDYYDKTPASLNEEDDYLAASEKYQLPILAGGWFYVMGRDEALLKQNLQLGARLGSTVHNTQILMHHADGHLLSNEEVANIYCEASEWGEQCSCLPTFEVHINMWSEDFPRISAVADIVEARGITFRMTLDHSHVIFKIDNEEEQTASGIRDAVESGALVLDPSKPNNVCAEWIERGFVWHAHARAAVPNNPKNSLAHHPDGRVGRGVQYPFIQPATGQYVEPWDELKLQPWKQVIEMLFEHHALNAESRLGQISTEFIPNTDYGEGNGYSLFDNSVACARWLRSVWESNQSLPA